MYGSTHNLSIFVEFYFQILQGKKTYHVEKLKNYSTQTVARGGVRIIVLVCDFEILLIPIGQPKIITVDMIFTHFWHFL